ncbi:MAG TPA: CaiB/BaiF CoA-transferase family protein [Candidatus Limnocylindrales bacterium]|nr:CaiB/BaiF CoA-transferase family protein [Candidatus Limnocylindrales bacterium]
MEVRDGSEPPNHGPLRGVRVIDCSTVLAGPFATMLLGDLGADVVKVEPPDGDATRGWGPPWVGSVEDGTRTAAYYLAVNRNKRSIRLDLSMDDGRDVLRRLLRDADAVVENHRVGGFAKLGFSDDVLRDLNPDLVHLAISGFGTRGPDADKPGYDFVIQAIGGLMSITGEPDGRPMKVGVAISDVVSGLFGAVSLLAGLLGRERSRSGESRGTPDQAGGSRTGGPPVGGQRIDVSLLQSTLAVLANQAQNALVTGAHPRRRGNAHPSIVPYETFGTADGEIAIGVGSERQWAKLGPAIGLPALATEARFATNGDRVTHRDELIPILAERFATDTSAGWLGRMEEAGIPAGPILDLPAAFSSPQARALGMRVPLEHEKLGRVDQVGLPFELAATPASIRTPPPLLGEHTDEILAEAGYAPAEIEALRAAAVV